MSTKFHLKIFLYFSSRSRNEILNVLEQDDDIQDIYIELLDVQDVTDEDSGDDDNFQISNLSGNQLRAPAHISNKLTEAEDNVTLSKAKTQISTRG